MTGYGAARRPLPGGGELVVEARSVNARHREVKVRHDLGLEIEHQVVRRVEGRIGRGRVHVTLCLEGEAGAGERWERTCARAQDLLARAEAQGLPMAPVALADLVALSSQGRRACPTAPEGWEAALDGALDALVAARLAEGEGLHADLSRLLDELETLTASLGPLAEAERARLAAELDARVQALAEQGLPAPEQARLRQELATLLLRGDTSEERVRIGIHLARAREILAEPAHAGQGKTLDFVGQELVREVATLGAKVTSHEAAAKIVDIKAIVERWREQVHNVE